MLKAKARGTDGRSLYIFGLSARNVELLIKGDPISFSGAEVQLQGHWFLIARCENEAQIRRHHEHFSVPGHRMHTLGLQRAVLSRLADEPARLRGESMKLDGDVLIIAGETEQALASYLGREVAPVQSGYRDDMDPVTGQMVRRKIERS